MPKGVEHNEILVGRKREKPVNGSEMPKGVEHDLFFFDVFIFYCEWI